MDRKMLVLWCLAILLPGVAWSSPWTLPPGTLALQLGYRAQNSDRQFNTGGELEPYSLEGHQFGQDADIRLRYGIAEGVEIELGGAYKALRYEAELLCLDTTATVTSPDDYGCPVFTSTGSHPYGDLRVLDFRTAVRGIADVEGLLKFRVLPRPVVLTLAPYVKVPAGYAPPGAVFQSATDDVVLGDGQVDLGGFAFLGASIVPARTFLRLDLGYLHRFGAPGDQVVGRIRMGHQIFSRWVLATGLELDKTVTRGEEIGTQGIRIEPDGAIVMESIRSERDSLTVDAAAILVVDGQTELVLSVFRIISGRYVASSTGVGIGLVRRFQ